MSAESVDQLADSIVVNAEPSGIDFERELVGAVLAGYPNLPELIRTVNAGDGKQDYGDFDNPHHAIVWHAIVQVHRSGESVNKATVFQQLGPAAHKMPGGASWLLNYPWLESGNARHFAEQVREARIRRDIRMLAVRMRRIETEDIEPREAVKLIRDWADGIDFGDDQRVKVSALEQVIDTAENGEPNATPTPWPHLTEVLGGWYPGQLITFAARPGVGKSIALENIASHMAFNSRPVLMVSLEMTEKELVQRRLAHVASVELTRLRRGGTWVTEDDWAKINRAAPAIEAYPIEYMDRSYGGKITVDVIRDEAWQVSRRLRGVGKELGAVLVDYCQIVDVPSGKLSRQQQVGEITRGLKRLAGELQIPVFTAAQLNRQSMARTNPIPQLHDLREAGDIEQDSDVVVLLHEVTVEDRDRILPTGDITTMVAKSRNSSQTTFTLQKVGRFSKFKEAGSA